MKSCLGPTQSGAILAWALHKQIFLASSFTFFFLHNTYESTKSAQRIFLELAFLWNFTILSPSKENTNNFFIPTKYNRKKRNKTTIICRWISNRIRLAKTLVPYRGWFRERINSPQTVSFRNCNSNTQIHIGYIV